MRVTVPFLFGFLGLASPEASAAGPVGVERPVAEIVGYIVKHPQSTIGEVVDFANQTLLPSLLLPVHFYSFTPDGQFAPMPSVAVPGGQQVKLGESSYNGCGVKGYWSSVHKLGERELVILMDGKPTTLQMPVSYSVAKITTSLGGKVTAPIPVSDRELPYCVSDDGRAAFYDFHLGSSEPALRQWWENTQEAHPALKREGSIPRLMIEASRDGFRFSKDLDRYRRCSVKMTYTPKKTGLYNVGWKLPNGAQVTVTNMCVPEFFLTGRPADLKREVLTFPKYDARKFNSEKSAGKPVVLLFTRPGCPVCHTQVPALEKILKTEPYNRLSIYQVNIAEQFDINREFRVTIQNTLVLFKEGEEIARSSGMSRPEVLKEFLGKLLR